MAWAGPCDEFNHNSPSALPKNIVKNIFIYFCLTKKNYNDKKKMVKNILDYCIKL
jgi:hypothetical protein